MGEPFFGFLDRCECCGRFVSIGAEGVSWSQTWSYQMDGTPELNDPRYRCSSCTDKFGIGWTNCAPSYPGNGRNLSPTQDGDEG